MKAKLCVLASMVVWGSVGLFSRGAGLPSAVLSLWRGIIGTAFLLLSYPVLRRRPDAAAIRKNGRLLALSGAAIGVNWIFLFEAYRFTSVSVGTVVYYLAPVFVVLLAPLILKERFTAARLLCAAAALAGMLLVAGADLFSGGAGQARGVLCALVAALLYTAVLFLNKFIAGVEGLDRTLVQIAAAALVLLPYVLLTEGVPAIPGPRALALTVFVGVVHTGLAYLVYFTALPALSAPTAALLGYVDPLAAMVFSALFLHERMTAPQLLGAALILGSTAALALRRET